MYKEYHFTADQVLVYLRKSRSDDPALSVEEVLEKHEKILNEYAVSHFGQLVPDAQVYREVASSETIDGRPEMLKLLRAVESPRMKAVLVVEVQRLSRGDLEDAGRLIKLLRYTDTKIITPYKIYDLQDEFDRDAFERELKRGNEYLEYFKKIQARGRIASVQDGNYIGPRPPYGYDKVFVRVGKKNCPTLMENPAQADVVRMIFDMYVNQDMGPTNICNRLDELGITPPKGKRWSPPGVRDMLANVHYIGKVCWERRKTETVVEDQEVRKTRPRNEEYLLAEGRHEAIISEDLFYAAQEKHGRNHRAKPATKIRNPFAGLLFCRCGRAMSYRQYKYPDGTVKSAPRLLCDDQAHCGYGSVEFSEMVVRVCEILQEHIDHFEIKLKENHEVDTVALHRKLIKNLEKQLADLEAKELAQWEAQADPDPAKRMPDYVFQRLNEKLLKEKEEVNRSIKAAYESAPPEPVDYAQKLVMLKDALAAMQDDDVPPELKNKYLKGVFERLDCCREKPVRVSKKEAEKLGMDTTKGHIYWYTPPFEVDAQLRI